MSDDTEAGTIEPTGEDAGGTADALRAFVEEDESEEVIPREKAEPEPKAKPEPKRDTRQLEPDTGEKEPPKKDEPEPEKPPEKRRIKVKDEEVDEDEVARGYMRGRDYTKKTQELAADRRKVAEFLDLIDKDPAQAFHRLGKGEAFTKAAEKAVLDLYGKEFGPDGQPLTPEQRRIRELEGEVATRQAAEKSVAEKAREAEENAARDEARQHWTRTIVKALEAAKLPKHLTGRVGGHLADAIAHDATIDPADFIEDAISLAWEDVKDEHRALFEAMPDEDFAAQFPQIIERSRKIIVARYKAGKEKPAPEPIERPNGPRRQAGRRMMSPLQALNEFASGK